MKTPSFHFYPITRQKILIATAAVLFVIAVQMYLIREIKAESANLQEAKEEAMMIKLVEAGREYAISQYNSKMGTTSIIMPSETETSSKFYSHLLAMLANQGFKNAEVSKLSEEGRLVSFKIDGTAEFGRFMHLMASFRQGSLLMCVSALDLEGMGDNMVRYSFTVTARTALKAENGKTK